MNVLEELGKWKYFLNNDTILLTTMHNIAIQKVRDLESTARQWVQRLLGRELKEEEEVAVLVRKPSSDRLEKVLDRMAEKASHIPEKKLDKLIDEALNHVRRYRD